MRLKVSTFVALVFMLYISDKCNGIKNEKELKQYFDTMTTQLDSCIPFLDQMIKSETNKTNKQKLTVIKKHIEELIKEKTALKNKCSDKKLSVKDCYKEAQRLSQEIGQVLINEVNSIKH